GVVHKVNLTTGAVTDVPYTLDSLEGGSWAVAIGPNGKGLVDTKFNGSGWVPLRQLTLSTDTLSKRTDAPEGGGVRQNSHIVRSADRSLFLLTEANSSDGPVFTYDATADTFSAKSRSDLFLDSAQSAVNRNGTLIALVVNGNVAVTD